MLSLFQIKQILHPVTETLLTDDFRILDSWAEYDENSSKDPEKRNLQYLCYEMEVMNPSTGERIHCYKAIKMARVIRLPADAKQSTALMDMQEQVLTAVNQQNANLITIIANVLKPVAVGLLYIYGIQGVASTINKAKEKAKHGFLGFVGSMQGTFRVLEMRCANAEETEWLREKMYNMDYLTVVRGIPKANKAGEDAGNKGMGGSNVNPDSQGTLEEIITGMADYEYVLEILSTPVHTDTLMSWQRQSQVEMTDWYGQLQGTKSLSLNLSIPMMYMANASQSQGWSKAYTDANTVSYARGESFTTSQGQSVGQSLSQTYGQSMGQSQGQSISNSYSQGVSHTQGVSFGQTFGHSIGQSSGFSINQSHGTSSGVSFGQSQGVSNGSSFGQSQGSSSGTSFGQSHGTSSGTSFGQSHGTSSGTSFGQSQGTSSGTSFGQSHGTSSGSSFGVSQNESTNVGTSVNHGVSQNTGISQGQSQSFNQGISHSYGTSQNQGISQSTNISQGHSVSQGNSYNMSYGQNTSQSHSVGNSQSYGWSQGQSMNRGQSASFGQSSSSSLSQGVSSSSSFGMSEGVNSSHGSSANYGQSSSAGHSSTFGGNFGGSLGLPFGTASGNASISGSSSDSASFGESSSNGISNSVGQSHGTSFGTSSGSSMSSGVSHGQSTSQGASLSYGSSAGISGSYGANESYGTNIGQSISQGWGANQSVSDSYSIGNGVSQSVSHGISESAGLSQSYGYGQSSSISNSVGVSDSMGMSYGHGVSTGISASQNVGQSDSTSMSQNFGQSQSQNFGMNFGQSQSQNMSQNYGQSASQNFGQNYGISSGVNYGQNYGQSVSQNVGQNYGISDSVSYGQNYGQSESYSQSQNYGQSESVGQSETFGKSVGQTLTNSVSQSASTGYGQNVGNTESVSNGNSYTTSNGSSQGTSNGTTGTSSMGTSSSMGLGPSIGYSKSYQWLDQGVKDLLELMEYQNERIKKALRGQGAFYTYVYIACPSLDALSTAQAVAKSTWQNEYAMVNPVQVLDLTETEQKHLLYHFSAFSADVTRENVFGAEEYKYCTVLLPEEYVAYTHLPRVSEGGVFSIVQDVPKFSVPARMQGDIYMGTILNPERFTFEHGYRTAFDYRIDENNLMHGFFTGASRSGKTVAAMRFIAELSKIRRKKTGKRLRIVVMDPKQDWRTLARFVEPERFNFYSMGNPNFNPIHINPWKVPHGVNPQVWIDGVIDIYCRAYGLLERGKQMIADVVYELYKENGVFDVSGSDSESKDLVAELSSRVNFQSIYRRMEEKRDKLTGAGKSGNDTKDAYARLIERLSCFSREYSIESKLYGSSEGIAIDDLIGADEVTVLESKGLENTFKNFIFGVITSGFFKFALAHEGGYLADDQYETVLVLEEANEVLTGNDCAGTGGGQNFGMSGQSEFEQILDQSAGYGLFIFAITQKIADMPSSVIANSGLVFAGRLKRTDDINVVVRTVGREERIDDRDLVKWFPRSPTGWFVCQTSRTFDFKDAEPILVQISRLNINPPSNIELDEILIQKKAKTIMSA